MAAIMTNGFNGRADDQATGPASTTREGPQTFDVDLSTAGQRLDRFIASQCPAISRTRVQELIEAGLVLIDASPAKKGAQHIQAGQRISVSLVERPAIQAEAESIPLDILYEDADLIVVNKRAGMTVHAGAGTAKGTLVNALLGRGQTLSQTGDPLRPGIVHRLDKETSGVILVAKNDFAHARLGEHIRQRSVKKTYVALLRASWPTPQAQLSLLLGATLSIAHA